MNEEELIFIRIYYNFRNLYILQPYSNNKLGLMRVKTSENMVMLPEMKTDAEDTYETGGWNLLSILNDIPKVYVSIYYLL
jgi:hypothetical protein